MEKGYKYYHWKLFNIFVRFLGAWFCIGGTVLALWGVWLLTNPNQMIDVNGVPTADNSYKYIFLFISMLIVVFGILMLKVKPYYPREKPGK